MLLVSALPTMPVEFCYACGNQHDPTDTDLCKSLVASESRTTRSSAKMAKAMAKDPVTEIEASVSSLSLEERRTQTLREIEELRLEDEVAQLEETRNELLHKRELRNQRKLPSSATAEGGQHKPELMSEFDTEMERPLEKAGTGYSNYGHSRRLSRDGRRQRHSSSSSSSGSIERKRRSNWSLKHHTIAKKDVRKLNCHELVCATKGWALDIPEMTTADHRALWQHLNFISHRARHNDFVDMAHVEYDLSIRKMAESMGFKAFSNSNNGSSVIHYGAQNMQVKKPNVGAVDGRKRLGEAWARLVGPVMPTTVRLLTHSRGLQV